MNEKTFIDLYLFLCKYNLTDKERKILLWRYGCNCSLKYTTQLLEVSNSVDDIEPKIPESCTDPIITAEALFVKIKGILEKFKHYCMGEEMSCLNCIWFKYVGKSRKYVYCSAGNIVDVKNEDVKIRWFDSHSVPLNESTRKNMKKLRGCKLFQSVKGD